MKNPTESEEPKKGCRLPLADFSDEDADKLSKALCEIMGIQQPKRGERIQWPENKS